MVVFFKIKNEINMYGLLLFIPTLALIPHICYFLPLLYSLILSKKTDKLEKSKNKMVLNKNLFIILMIIVSCFLNSFFSSKNISNLSEIVPYTILMLLSYFYSFQINKKHLSILIFLILIESIVVILEYAVGVNTFIPQLNYLNESIGLGTGDLYNTRPLGLSSNSSVVAIKIFLAFLLLDYLKLKSFKFQLFRMLFLIAMFLTFNRTILLVLLMYLFLQNINTYKKIYLDFLYFKLLRNNQIKSIFGTFIIFSFIIFSVVYLDSIISQFSRGTNTVNLSGRDEIWAKFIDFIYSHFWFGNGSAKVYVDYYTHPIHAHNSFLQTLANNGIIIFLMFLSLIFMNTHRKNMIYIISMIMVSMFQYGVFWGISFMDIIFFVILFRTNPYNGRLSEVRNCKTDVESNLISSKIIAHEN